MINERPGMNETTNEPAPPCSHIVTAISRVMAEVGSVAKNGTNDFHHYKFAAVGDVLHKLQPLLAREGLVIKQSEVEREVIDGALCCKYSFIPVHTSGEIWPVADYHTGMATLKNSKGGIDDKAANKCHTAARKYYLLALFQIPTGDYDDPDADEGPAPVKSAKPSGNPNPRNPAAEEAARKAHAIQSEAEKATRQDITALLLLAERKGKTESQVLAWCHKAGIHHAAVDGLTADELKVVTVALEKLADAAA